MSERSLPRISVGTTLTVEEADRLDALCDLQGVTRSHMIRLALLAYDRQLTNQPESVFERKEVKPS